MIIKNDEVTIWKQEPGIDGMYAHIERCARVCYRSESNDKISSQKFVKGLINKKHMRCCEMGTVGVKSHNPIWFLRSMFSPWVLRVGFGKYITNLRYFVEVYGDSWESELKKRWFDFDTFIRPTVCWEVARYTADSFRTHVTLSSLMESTRYVNYSKGNKKTSSVNFASTHWFADKPENLKQKLIEFWELAENYYNFFTENGLKPEDARDSLPLSIRTRLVQCGYHKAWNNFFNLRCAPAAHPDAQAIAKKLKALFKAEEKFY